MKKCKRNIVKAGAIASLLIIQILQAKAQDGNAGIQQANTQVRSYFESGTNLMYAIGAIVGLIGAVKVYQKWTVIRYCCGTIWKSRTVIKKHKVI